MKLYRIRSYDEYLVHEKRNEDFYRQHKAYLQKVVPASRKKFTVPGYSYTADKQVQFLVDYQHSGGSGVVNWRERVACPITYFNNRMRATFHLFDIEMQPYTDIKLYITEQVTPIYKYFAERYPLTTGSEFLGESLPFGSCDKKGIRNENLCALSFPDKSFDTLVSLDVLEHIPDYLSAFLECARVLKDGGKMMWSVPFIASSPNNLVRSKIVNGQIVHVHPPEYHGDPLSGDGVLCYQHFGWEMLDQMRAAGFRDAYAIAYLSAEFGYLGNEQLMFVGIK
jgi:SAM-dependent methyltransferase